jgi:hypothetical protein
VRSDRLGDVVNTLLTLDPRRLLALGAPGSGKSTLLAMTVLRLAERHLGDVPRGVLGYRGTRPYCCHWSRGAFSGRDGWYLVLPLSIRPVMPPDVVEAFVRFSGGRWQG